MRFPTSPQKGTGEQEPSSAFELALTDALCDYRASLAAMDDDDPNRFLTLLAEQGYTVVPKEATDGTP